MTTVAYDACPGAINVNNITSTSWTHTAGGTADYLRVSMGWSKLGTTTLTVTHNGTSMNSVGVATNAAGFGSSVTGKAQIYELIAPATGAQTVQATWSAGGNFGGGTSVSYTGADQTTPSTGVQTSTGTGTGPSVAVTSQTNDMVSDCLCSDGTAGTKTVGAGQTSRANASGSGYGGCVSDEAGASSVTMSWTQQFSAGYAYIAANIVQASGGGSHPTSGTLTGPGSTVAGTAAHIAKHATSGVLTGQGSTVAGTASNFTPHATSGVLVGQGAVVSGAAERTGSAISHATSGALTGQGASVVGTAAHVAKHATSGALVGQGAQIVGAASGSASVVEPPLAGGRPWSASKKKRIVSSGTRISSHARHTPQSLQRRHCRSQPFLWIPQQTNGKRSRTNSLRLS